jgi:23S rRNA (guanosine2251-2'-O)-methyltransferase
MVAYADLDEILIAAIEAGRTPLVLMLDGITDVRNFGAIARSAECAGATAIVIPSTGSAPINGDAMKTSAGALNYVPVCRTESLPAATELLKNYGIQIAAACADAPTTIYDTPLHLPTAFLMGAEDIGVTSTLLRISDLKVQIPMMGQIESLNVAAAASVMLFEALRQRRSF